MAKTKYTSLWHSPEEVPEQRNPNFPNGDWLVRILVDRKIGEQIQSVLVPYKNWQRVLAKYPDMRGWCYIEDCRKALVEQ